VAQGVYVPKIKWSFCRRRQDNPWYIAIHILGFRCTSLYPYNAHPAHLKWGCILATEWYSMVFKTLSPRMALLLYSIPRIDPSHRSDFHAIQFNVTVRIFIAIPGGWCWSIGILLVGWTMLVFVRYFFSFSHLCSLEQLDSAKKVTSLLTHRFTFAPSSNQGQS